MQSSEKKKKKHSSAFAAKKVVHISDSLDISENRNDHNGKEMPDLQDAQTPVSVNEFQLWGILWLTEEADFKGFPLVYFSEEQMTLNRSKPIKIFEDVCWKYALKYHEDFSQNVMDNWETWLESEKLWWDPLAKSFTQNIEHPSLF